MIPRIVRLIAVAIALAFTTGTVSADSRSDAKTHYQAGVKYYNSGDFRSAIREFSSAQQLAPADLNLYNLALCYDKLGDPEPALQNYRAFLDKQPNSDKRGEIEASIARLDAAKGSAAKKADDDLVKRQADEARREEAARQAEEARREDARRAEEARRVQPDGRDAPPAPMPSGPSGNAPTGDAQLDRAQQIDIGQLRDQRMGRNDPGPRNAGPAPSGPNGGYDPNQGYDPNARRVAENPPPRGEPGPGAPSPDDKPKAKPIYKKWWFWVVVGVGAFVVYRVATDDSKSSDNFSRVMPPLSNAPQQSGGMTLMSW